MADGTALLRPVCAAPRSWHSCLTQAWPGGQPPLEEYAGLWLRESSAAFSLLLLLDPSPLRSGLCPEQRASLGAGATAGAAPTGAGSSARSGRATAKGRERSWESWARGGKAAPSWLFSPQDREEGMKRGGQVPARHSSSWTPKPGGWGARKKASEPSTRNREHRMRVYVGPVSSEASRGR